MPPPTHAAPSLATDDGGRRGAGPLGEAPPVVVAPESTHAPGDRLSAHAGSVALRQARRRRSATPLPPLPRPVDIPEDAAGRVQFITVAAPADRVPPEPAAPAAEVAAAVGVPEPALRASLALGGWLPVCLLGAAIVVVFIVGWVATR